ncbi:hypothetical protein BDF19DRAFT_414699 [Syncephalis fuscata]|nr:hypothetical protein BDF19DRAFT_414699 [Syncephalis fuscata]
MSFASLSGSSIVCPMATQRPKPPTGYYRSSSRSPKATTPVDTKQTSIRKAESIEDQQLTNHPSGFNTSINSLDSRDEYIEDEFACNTVMSQSSLLPASPQPINNWDGHHLLCEIDITQDIEKVSSTRQRRLEYEMEQLSNTLAIVEEERDALKTELKCKEDANARLVQETRKSEDSLKKVNDRLSQLVPEHARLMTKMRKLQTTGVKDGYIFRQAQRDLLKANQHIEVLEKNQAKCEASQSQLKQQLQHSHGVIRSLQQDCQNYAADNAQWRNGFTYLCDCLNEHNLLITNIDEHGRQYIQLDREKLASSGNDTSNVESNSHLKTAIDETTLPFYPTTTLNLLPTNGDDKVYGKSLMDELNEHSSSATEPGYIEKDYIHTPLCFTMHDTPMMEDDFTVPQLGTVMEKDAKTEEAYQYSEHLNNYVLDKSSILLDADNTTYKILQSGDKSIQRTNEPDCHHNTPSLNSNGVVSVVCCSNEKPIDKQHLYGNLQDERSISTLFISDKDSTKKIDAMLSVTGHVPIKPYNTFIQNDAVQTQKEQRPNSNWCAETYINDRKNELANEIKNLNNNNNGSPKNSDEDFKTTAEFFKRINNTLANFAEDIDQTIQKSVDENVGINQDTIIKFHKAWTPVATKSDSIMQLEYLVAFYEKRATMAEEQVETFTEQLKTIYASGGQASETAAAVYTELNKTKQQQQEKLLEHHGLLVCIIHDIREHLLSALLRVKNSNNDNLDSVKQKDEILSLCVESNSEINLDICLNQTITWINQLESAASRLELSANNMKDNKSLVVQKHLLVKQAPPPLPPRKKNFLSPRSIRIDQNYSLMVKKQEFIAKKDDIDSHPIFYRLIQFAWSAVSRYYSTTKTSSTNTKHRSNFSLLSQSLSTTGHKIISLFQAPFDFIYLCIDIWAQVVRTAIHLTEKTISYIMYPYHVESYTIYDRFYSWISYYW